MKDIRAALASCASTVELLDLFEEAWQQGKPLRIDDVLASAAARKSGDRPALLQELVATDLEYRWRGKPTGIAPWALEEYGRRYPELGSLDRLPLELIAQEYRVRQCWGDRPGHAEYATRFAGHGARLQAMLAGIDAELAAEFGRDRRGLVVTAAAARAAREEIPAVTTVNLPETLRSQQLLTAIQLTELDRSLLRQFPEPRALARELLRRNWLTPYQVNQLLQGRGRDLIVGPYVLLERLGEGGAGQVFKARQHKLDRVVALKVIRQELLTDAEVLARFQREIQVLSQLDHPNIVRAFDAGHTLSPSPHAGEGGVRGHFLAMEFVEGSDLGRLVKQGGPMPVLQACEYMRQAASGLQHAHERGLVHRDIKPHNLIMSVRDGLIKVADLGLARLPRLNQEATSVANGQEGTGTLTPRNAVIGTPDYMAPEQALEFRNADIRADIYSLGCTFFYLLTGQPPFPGGTLAQTLLRHQQTPPPAIDKLRKDIPAGLPAVLAKMLAKRPEDRYQKPAEVATALASLTGPAPARPRRLPRLPIRSWWGTPLGRRLILGGLAAILLLSLAVFFLYRSDDTTRRDAVTVIAERPGTPEALQAGKVLMDMPSPLDRLDSKNIPPELRTAGMSPEVVAVLHPGGIPKMAWCVAFSWDGKLLASGGQDGDIYLWDTATGKKRSVLRGHGDFVRGLAFAPDGQVLASVSDDKTVRLWDMALVREKFTLGKHPAECTQVTFALDGKLLATSCRAGIVQFWEMPSGSKKTSVQTKNGGVASLSLSPDNQSFAVGNDLGVEIWKVAGGKEPFAFFARSGRLVAHAPDGRTLAHGSHDAPYFQMRDVEANSVQNLELKQHLHSTPRHLGYSLDGKTLVTSIDDGTVVMWDATTRQQTGFWQMSRDSLTSPIGAALAPDGRHLATAHQNGNVYIRRLISAPKK